MSDPVVLPDLTISGYRPQARDAVYLVNDNKRMEEEVLRALDHMTGNTMFDQRWTAIARTNIEQGFMAINRAVFRPSRVRLPGDPNNGEPK